MRLPARPLRAVAVLAAAVALASGCQAFAPTRPAILRVAPAGVATGLVRLDLAKLRAAWAPRALKTLGGTTPSIGSVQDVRLTVSGPGVPSGVSATAAFAPPQGETGPLVALTLAVPAGQNRIFTLEGLNAEGQPVRRLMAAAAVTGGEPVALDMTFLSDAVARVLDDLVRRPALTASEAEAFEGLEGDQLLGILVGGTAPDRAGIAAALGTTDLVAPLTAHVDAVVGYEAGANIFSATDPVHFRARLLANLLRLDGPTVLAATPDPRLATTGAASFAVQVLDSAGAPFPAAAVALYDPRQTTGSPKTAGTWDFAGVPAGEWTAAATYGGTTVYQAVTVLDGAPTGLATLTLPLAAPTPTPSPTPIVTTYALEPGARILAFDAAGDAWIANPAAQNVVKFRPSSSATFGPYTAGDAPNAVAVDASGNAWVANTGTDDVTKFAPDGTELGTFSAGDGPAHVAIDGGGNAWISDSSASAVTRLAADGTVIGAYGVGTNPQGLAIAPDGAVWVANSGDQTVSKLSASGSPLGTYAVGYGPWAVAIDGDGNAWVTNNTTNTVTKLSSTGSTLGTYPVGASPRGIAIDAAGNAWVANYADDTVMKLSSTGVPLATIAVGDTPFDVKIDAAGAVWVTNYVAGALSKIVP